MAASHRRRDRPRVPGLRLACRRFGFQHRAVDAQLSQCARRRDLRFRPAAAVCADLARDRPLGEDPHPRALSCLVVRGQRRFHRGNSCRQQCGGTDSLGILRRSCVSPKIAPMKKIFTATLGTETNTFASIPTGHQLFEETCLYRKGSYGKNVPMFGAPLAVWRGRAEAKGWQVVESLCAFAMPAGKTVKKVYEAFRDEILADLRAAMPVDGVLLSMQI